MTIFCKICGHKVVSFKPDQEAQQDVILQMGHHLQIHKPESEDLKQGVLQATQLITTYLLIKRFVIIPITETALLRSFQENQDILRSVFVDDTQEVAN